MSCLPANNDLKSKDKYQRMKNSMPPDAIHGVFPKAIAIAARERTLFKCVCQFYNWNRLQSFQIVNYAGIKPCITTFEK